MKKTIDINLGGMLFHMDEDAYAVLSSYLEALRRHLAATEGREEVLSDIEARIAELLTPAGTQAKVKVVYQTVVDLHEACPNSPGDWYFTGNYPTPGGVRVANRSFVNYMEGKTGRAY